MLPSVLASGQNKKIRFKTHKCTGTVPRWRPGNLALKGKRHRLQVRLAILFPINDEATSSAVNMTAELNP